MDEITDEQEDSLLGWTYQGKEYTTLDKNVYGFIYCLILDTGEKYIGKKQCHKKLTLPSLKSGEIRDGAQRIGRNKNGKRVYYDVIYKENDWRTYESSSDLVKDKTVVSKEILELAPTMRSLTYLEAKWQFKLDVLEDDNYLNKNIGGRYFRNNLL